LVDLRVGFVELEAIAEFRKLFCGDQPRQLSLSMHNFGRTGNCWVIRCPEFEIDRPVDVAQWKAPLTPLGGTVLGDLIQHTVPKLTAVDLNDQQLGDEVFVNLIRELGRYEFDVVNFNQTHLGDASIGALIEFMGSAPLGELKIQNNDFSDAACVQFFEAIRELPTPIPPRIAIGFRTDDGDELALHSAASAIGELIEHDAPIEELRLSGSVTVVDVQTMLENLGRNSHLKWLQIDSLFTSRYASPDPELPPAVQEQFDRLAKHLLNVLSKCKLQWLKYPLLTEVFVYSDAMLKTWPECEAKLEQNRKPARTSRTHR
jgi:hypothetical protein